MPPGVFKPTEETKRKISKALKGRVFTKEWKQKISETKKGSVVKDETRKKISKTMTGMKKTEEHRRKISEAKKELYKNPKNHSCYKDGRTIKKHHCLDCNKRISFRAKRCNPCSNKNKWLSPEYKENVAIAMARPEYKKKISESSKQQWKDGKMDGIFMSPTKPEKEIMRILKQVEIDYVFQFRPENFSMIYDFYISKLNLLIEFDGVYWHSLPKVKIRDVKKTQYAKENHYDLLRISEHTLCAFEGTILNLLKK